MVNATIRDLRCAAVKGRAMFWRVCTLGEQESTTGDSEWVLIHFDPKIGKSCGNCPLDVAWIC
jgi:hypothetical protein